MSRPASGTADGNRGKPQDGSPGWRRIAIGGGGGMLVARGIGRFSYTAMVPALVATGELSAVDAGRVGTVNFIGFLLGAAFSVTLGRWVSRRGLLIGALGAALAGLVASGLVGGLLPLAAARGLIGIATGIIMVNSLALIAETAPPDRRAQAGSYVFAGVGLGILCSGVLVPRLLAVGLTAAWLGLALVACAAAAAALWGWWRAPPPPAAPALLPGERPARSSRPLRLLLLAHALFSFGIAPHSLYWVDFLVRERGLGIEAGGLHWSLVGVFAFLGPLICAGLAGRIGTARALVVAFVLLGLGIGAPWVTAVGPVLLASSVLFGAQPGVSALMAARARDLGEPSAMGRVMRAMILANATGGALGGLLIPWAYGAIGAQAPLLLMGGGAMLAAAVAAWPREHRKARA